MSVQEIVFGSDKLNICSFSVREILIVRLFPISFLMYTTRNLFYNHTGMLSAKMFIKSASWRKGVSKDDSGLATKRALSSDA